MVNTYFNFITQYTEQDLLERLIIEAIQMYGMDIIYVPKTEVDYDKLLGEDPQKAFKSSFTIEGYFENVEGFMGDKNFLNKLGLNIDKQANFVVAKRRFDEVKLGLNWRDFWQLGNSYSVNDAVHYQGQIFVNILPVTPTILTVSNVTGYYAINDPIVGQLHGATATVFSFDPIGNTITLSSNITGSFFVSEIIMDTNTVSNGNSTFVSVSTGTNVPPNTDTTHWQLMQQVRPKEGDLIYLPLTHDLFEILFADHEEVFYQLGKIYVWKITCEKFRYSHEEIDTGIPDIDSIAEELENNESVKNDPLADNRTIQRRIDDFLNLDPNSPF